MTNNQSNDLNEVLTSIALELQKLNRRNYVATSIQVNEAFKEGRIDSDEFAFYIKLISL